MKFVFAAVMPASVLYPRQSCGGQLDTPIWHEGGHTGRGGSVVDRDLGLIFPDSLFHVNQENTEDRESGPDFVEMCCTHMFNDEKFHCPRLGRLAVRAALYLPCSFPELHDERSESYGQSWSQDRVDPRLWSLISPCTRVLSCVLDEDIDGSTRHPGGDASRGPTSSGLQTPGIAWFRSLKLKGSVYHTPRRSLQTPYSIKESLGKWTLVDFEFETSVGTTHLIHGCCLYKGSQKAQLAIAPWDAQSGRIFISVPKSPRKDAWVEKRNFTGNGEVTSTVVVSPFIKLVCHWNLVSWSAHVHLGGQPTFELHRG
ncbi:hypothetical protein DFH09DRAFT_1074893 [Mycena vulgaris]|nr:hypothetical protein DFH09DRAFT_1074893 [Mycena vulgaris]